MATYVAPFISQTLINKYRGNLNDTRANSDWFPSTELELSVNLSGDIKSIFQFFN
jgi:hypothetical protein